MKKRLLTGILVVVLLVLILPVIVANLYTFPCADDYADANSYIMWGASLTGLGRFIANTYTTWQGTYFPVMYFPLYHYVGLAGFRWFMLGNTVLFLGTAILFIHGYVSFFRFKADTYFQITIILAIGFFGLLFLANPLNESLYFYTGAMIYTLPQSIAYIAMYCALQLKRAKGKSIVAYTLLGVCCGALAAGGNTPVVVLLCSMLVLGIILDCCQKKFYAGRWFITAVSVVGALVNIAAPGWRARYSGYNSEEFHMLASITTGMKDTVFYLLRLLWKTGPYLMIVCGVVFCIFYKYLKDSMEKFRMPGFVWLYGFLACFAGALPSIMGFQGAMLPARCSFVILSMLYLYTCYAMYYTTGWLAKKEWASRLENIMVKRKAPVVFACSIVCVALFGIFVINLGPRNMIWPKMVWHMAKGDYKAHDIRYRFVLEQLEGEGEANRMIVAAPLEDDEWVNVQGVGLTEDPNIWTNISIAQYFGLESVELRWVRYDQMENPPIDVD